jgi:Ferritin-like domain
MSEQLSPLESNVDEIAELIAGVDPEGALQETAAAVFPRGDFLRRAAGAVAAGVGGSLVGAAAGSAAGIGSLSANDIKILQFDLVLEWLQAGLYTEAEELGALTPETLEWARVVGAHERAHAAAIKALLGARHLVPKPTFNYGKITADEKPFQRTAVAFEDLTSALLKWQAPRLDSRPLVGAVATLHSVETRHAAWIRRRVGLPPVTSAFDKPAAQEKMARLIASTHFIVAKPRTTAKSRPRFTG